MRSCRVLVPKLCTIGLLYLKLWLTKHTNQLKSYFDCIFFSQMCLKCFFYYLEKISILMAQQLLCESPCSLEIPMVVDSIL